MRAAAPRPHQWIHWSGHSAIGSSSACTYICIRPALTPDHYLAPEERVTLEADCPSAGSVARLRTAGSTGHALHRPRADHLRLLQMNAEARLSIQEDELEERLSIDTRLSMDLYSHGVLEEWRRADDMLSPGDALPPAFLPGGPPTPPQDSRAAGGDVDSSLHYSTTAVGLV